MEKSYHSFLMGLKGKTVTIYKGGPESKKGKLLQVNPDFITLLVENTNNVIYYQVHQIKSVIEDTKTTSVELWDPSDLVKYHEAERFSSLLEKLVGEMVLVNQGGPDSRRGKLVAVFEDFIVLFTDDDGLVYINIFHMKSVSVIDQANQEVDSHTAPEWIGTEHFQDLFKHFLQHWITIKSGGPENIEGVLVEITGGHYTLVNNQDVIRIQPFHIQSVSVGPKGHMKQNKQNENNEEKNDHKDSKESSNHREESSSSESSSSESSSDNRRSSSSTTRSSRRHTTSRERIIKTIDYKWKF